MLWDFTEIPPKHSTPEPLEAPGRAVFEEHCKNEHFIDPYIIRNVEKLEFC
jgi:hypothetical protein